MTNLPMTAITVTSSIPSITLKQAAVDFHLPSHWVSGLNGIDLGNGYRIHSQRDYSEFNNELLTPLAVLDYFLNRLAYPAVEPIPPRRDINGTHNLLEVIPDACDFLRSGFMRAVESFVDDGIRPAREDEIDMTITQLLNRPHQQGLKSALWYGECLEIIQEFGPTISELILVRKTLMKSASFAPTPAQFYSELCQARKTLNYLSTRYDKLVSKMDEGLEFIGERIRLYKDEKINSDQTHLLAIAADFCYNKRHNQPEDEDTNVQSISQRQIALGYLAENGND